MSKLRISKSQVKFSYKHSESAKPRRWETDDSVFKCPYCNVNFQWPFKRKVCILFRYCSDIVQILFRSLVQILFRYCSDIVQIFFCFNVFSFLWLQHHCRSCGTIICDECSKHKLPVPRIGYMLPVRICDNCYGEFRAFSNNVEQSTQFRNSFVELPWLSWTKCWILILHTDSQW